MVKVPNLAGLARTCEVFRASSLVVHDAKVMKDPSFINISVSVRVAGPDDPGWLPYHHSCRSLVRHSCVATCGAGLTLDLQAEKWIPMEVVSEQSLRSYLEAKILDGYHLIGEPGRRIAALFARLSQA